MRVNAKENPELAARVQTVKLDGKPLQVGFVHAFDTVEGWVESYVPNLPNNLSANGGGVDEDGLTNSVSSSDMKLVKRYGKVEVGILK